MNLSNPLASIVALSKSFGIQSYALEKSIRIVPAMPLVPRHLFQAAVARNKACWLLYPYLKPDSREDKENIPLKWSFICTPIFH